MTPEVVIADTGGTNFASLRLAFERLGALTQVTSDGSTIASADRVVLPGVGAARHSMECLRERGLISVLRTLTQPVLGICLGMQLLFHESAEGAVACLSLLPGAVHRLTASPGLPVPHAGWNQVRRLKDDPLFDGIADREYAYFVHSYAAGISEFTLASTEYGSPLAAVVRRRNFCGTQFHPERSGRTGAQLLDNFLRL
ncbi:MAG: imidazole glycerol phosphate synthase subunit HisH [Terriglobales bacterium]